MEIDKYFLCQLSYNDFGVSANVSTCILVVLFIQNVCTLVFKNVVSCYLTFFLYLFQNTFIIVKIMSVQLAQL